jgi:uncharacterized protein YbjT (DUF2867 family)
MPPRLERISNMTKVLVTGATGTTGRQIVDALGAKGLEVRAGVRTPERAGDLGLAEVVRLDFEAEDTLIEALHGVDAAYLVTPFIEDAVPYVERFLAAATGSGLGHVVRLSSAGADPASDFGLARTHGLSEERVKASGIPWTILRPSFFMDNLLNFGGETIKKDGAFYGAAGDAKVAYVSSRDIADVVATVLAHRADHRGKTYALTGPDAVTNHEAAALLTKVTGKTVKYVDLTPEELAKGAASNGVPSWMAEAIGRLELVKRNGWAATVSPDVEAVLGRRGETLEAFLARNGARLR